MNRGLTGTDNGGGIDLGSGVGGRAGESNGEKGGTPVIEQKQK